MEEALIKMLLAASGVEALAADRVFPNKRPQGSALPCVEVHVFPRPRAMSHGGANTPREARFQINALGRTYAEIKGLERAIRAALTGFRGVAFGVTFSQIREDGGAGDSFEHNPPDQVHRWSGDFIVWAVAP